MFGKKKEQSVETNEMCIRDSNGGLGKASGSIPDGG